MRRRGFAVHGLVVLLAVVVLGLGLYKASFVWGVKTHTARASGYKVGVTASPFIFIGAAALLGWVAYRITRRSDGVGNGVAGLVLAFPAALWGYQVGNYWMNGSKAAPQQALGGASAPSSTRQALRNTLESMKSPVGAGRAPAPTGALPPGSPWQPLVPERGPGQAPTGAAPASGAPASSPPKPVPIEEDPKIEATLEALTFEVDADGAKVAALAETAAASLAKAPRRDRPGLKKRLAEIAALEEAAKALAARAEKLKDEAAEKLTAAGVEKDEVFHASVRYSMESGAMLRGMAAGDLLRLCEAGREETEFLDQNFAKWNLGRDGEVDSKDVMVKGRARGFRMRIESALDRKADIIERLKGKT